MPPTDATVVPVRGPLSAGRSEAVVAGTTRSISPAAGELLFWAAHLAFWMLVLAASIVIVQVFRPAITDPVPFVAVRVGLCFAATAAMRWLSRQEPLLTRLGLSKIGLVAGGSLLSAVLITLTLFWVDRASGRVTEAPSRLELVARLAINLTMLANWCALYFGYQLIRERNSTEFRAMQAESLALKNELEHLQGQISPHFLFNSLNTVLACRQDPHDDIFHAAGGGNRRDPQFDVQWAVLLELDLAVLRLAALGDVQVAHDLQARDHGLAKVCGHFDVRHQRAIDPEPDAGLEFARHGLDVDVGRFLVVGVDDDLVDELDEFVVGGRRLQGVFVDAIVDRPAVHVGQQLVDGAPFCACAIQLAQRFLEFRKAAMRARASSILSRSTV